MSVTLFGIRIAMKARTMARDQNRLLRSFIVVTTKKASG
ncbi:MAG: hypothetical protein HNEKOMLI_00885 [Sodalis sp. Psp]|nr:hypothetical protein [Sodalis sp. Psp]MCR3757344.1 hypothetical protein [Sodalis sp. Ppy]